LRFDDPLNERRPVGPVSDPAAVPPATVPSGSTDFAALLRRRIVLLDGAMGTMIERRRLTETECRGARFASWRRDLRGNHDVLVLTQPQLVAGIHRAYLDAGADVITTNTFNASPVAQAEFGTGALAAELNLSAARLARAVADEVSATSGRRRFVAGTLGPTARSASRAPGNQSPPRAGPFQPIDGDELTTGYAIAARALLEGGVDLLLLETVFDTANAQAACGALRRVFDQAGFDLPVIVSCTLDMVSGRMLCGDTPAAFWNALRAARPIAVGVNCGRGVQALRPSVEELARVADVAVCVYPSAGLPNAHGEYPETPAKTAAALRELAADGLLNLVGGCCGTTPAHIRAIAGALSGLAPRALPVPA
jgi:5-methyltetrahydrofolate--homocysteine methyltransferase